MLWRCLLLFCLLVALIWISTVQNGATTDALEGQGATASQSDGARSAFVTQEQPFRFLGPSTCASMNCHNGPGLRGGEYATWVAQDKHARAYQTLGNEKSRHIIKNLHSGNGAHHPQREPLCLQCHVMPNVERASIREATFVSEGVSCEACHGPAEQWLVHHHRPGWQTLSAADKRRYGMRDTASIVGRAETCVACHIGAPGMEVNHDLIAAGHPALNFEFAAFHALLPHHWSDRKDKEPAFGGRADFEARAWLIGQVACTRAALELLAHRATSKTAPWPEFAEYDCYACHQQLQGRLPGMRTASAGGDKVKRRPGSLPWSRWHHADLDTLAHLIQSEPTALRRTMTDLETEMTEPAPERSKTARFANQANVQVLEVQQMLQHRDAARIWNVPELFSRMVAVPPTVGSWETSAQRYLGLAALHNAWKDMKPTELPVAVTSSLQKLKGTLEGPGRHSVDSFRKSMDDLNNSLRER